MAKLERSQGEGAGNTARTPNLIEQRTSAGYAGDQDVPGLGAVDGTGSGVTGLRTFDSFRNRQFRLYWFAMMGQMGAMNMQMMARVWFAYDLTGSATMLGAMALVIYFVFIQQDTNGQSRRPRRSSLTLEQIPFDGQASFGWIEKLCALGPRVSGTEGMKKQQALLAEHFKALGGTVEMQDFAVRHPVHGNGVPMANLIVRWHPEVAPSKRTK